MSKNDDGSTEFEAASSFGKHSAGLCLGGTVLATSRVVIATTATNMGLSLTPSAVLVTGCTLGTAGVISGVIGIGFLCYGTYKYIKYVKRNKTVSAYSHAL